MEDFLINPEELMLSIARNHSVDSKWSDSIYESIKYLGNTSKGAIGESFVQEYASKLGFSVSGEGNRLGSHDLTIEKQNVEVKTATEDVSGAFQFNHLRLDYKYSFIVCLGISPNRLLFGIWTKSQLATGDAGNLVSMGKGQNSSFKLTKRNDKLYPITKFKDKLKEVL